MRIIHVSDTHGKFPELKGYGQVVVHSGDFCPDFICNDNQPAYYQEIWLKEKVVQIKNWLNGRPLLFCLGNHDHISPTVFEKVLKDAGIEAYDLTEKVVVYGSVNFYGFPYVPTINGKYAYECNIYQMQDRVDAMLAVTEVMYIDVIVAHCPPANCLDYDHYQDRHFGNTSLTQALDYKWSRDMLPQAILVGHIHSNNGVTIKNGVLISNAATTQNIIEI